MSRAPESTVWVDEVLVESAIACAQATIFATARKAGINRTELARRLGVTRPAVTFLGQRDFRISTFAKAILACGYEIRFKAVRRKEPKGGR